MNITCLFRRLCGVLFFAVLLVPSVFAEEPRLHQLLTHSPSPANSMGFVNVESLNKLLRDQGIQGDVAKNVNDFWFVADLDLGKMSPRWEAGYSNLKRTIDPETLAQAVRGYVDEVDDVPVVWSPEQTYLVPGKEQQLGILRPANRTLLSGWLARRLGLNASEYLLSQAKQPESFLSMMLAVDLQNAFSPVTLEQRLLDFKSLKSNQPSKVARVLASIEGVSIIIGRKSLNECIMTAKFSNSPKSLLPIATDLLSEMLEKNGTAASEVSTWKVDGDESQLTFKGPITEATMSGLLSIFSLQSQANRVAQSLSSGAEKRTEEQQMGYASKNYFDDVNAIIEQTRKHKAQTTGALAKWNDQRARKIDELGTLNIDPAMIQYGTDVASLLRGNALTVRQGNITAGKTMASQSLNSGYYGNGYYDTNTTVDYQRVTSAYARGNAYSNYRDVLSQIDQRTADIRRVMTDKYKIQF